HLGTTILVRRSATESALPSKAPAKSCRGAVSRVRNDNLTTLRHYSLSGGLLQSYLIEPFHIKVGEQSSDSPSLLWQSHPPQPPLRSSVPFWPSPPLAQDFYASDRVFPCPRWLLLSQHASL